MCNIHFSLSMYFYTYLADTADKKKSTHVAYSSNELEIRTNSLIIFVVLGNTHTFILSQKILLFGLSLRTFKWVSFLCCPLRANPTRCHCVTPGTRQSQLPPGEDRGGKSRAASTEAVTACCELSTSVALTRILFWCGNCLSNMAAAPRRSECALFINRPRRAVPGKEACQLTADAGCQLSPRSCSKLLLSGLRRVGHLTNLIVSKKCERYATAFWFWTSQMYIC